MQTGHPDGCQNFSDLIEIKLLRNNDDITNPSAPRPTLHQAVIDNTPWQMIDPAFSVYSQRQMPRCNLLILYSLYLHSDLAAPTQTHIDLQNKQDSQHEKNDGPTISVPHALLRRMRKSLQDQISSIRPKLLAAYGQCLVLKHLIIFRLPLKFYYSTGVVI